MQLIIPVNFSTRILASATGSEPFGLSKGRDSKMLSKFPDASYGLMARKAAGMDSKTDSPCEICMDAVNWQILIRE